MRRLAASILALALSDNNVKERTLREFRVRSFYHSLIGQYPFVL